MYVTLVIILNNCWAVWIDLYNLLIWCCKAFYILNLRSNLTFHISYIYLSVFKLIAASICSFHIVLYSIIYLWFIPLCIKCYIGFWHNFIEAFCTLLVGVPACKCITSLLRNLCNNLCSPLDCLCGIIKLSACCIICNVVCTSVIVYFKYKTAVCIHCAGRHILHYSIAVFIIICHSSRNRLSCCSLCRVNSVKYISAILIFKIILCRVYNIIWLFPYSSISHVWSRNCITYLRLPACKIISRSVYRRCWHLCSICITALRNNFSFWYELYIVLISCIIVIKLCTSISLNYLR